MLYIVRSWSHLDAIPRKDDTVEEVQNQVGVILEGHLLRKHCVPIKE